MQVTMAMIGCAAAATVGVAALAEHRRAQRRDLDRVGFVSWPLVSLLATAITFFAFALALRGGG